MAAGEGVSGETEVKFFTVFCGRDKRRWKKGSGRREAAKRQGVYGNFILGRNDTGGEIGYNDCEAGIRPAHAVFSIYF